MMEAEGEAAKAWLANYYPNWRHFVGEEDLAQPSNMEKEKLSCVAVLKACGSADEPQAQGSCSSGEKFPKFHLFQSFFYKGRTYERKLSLLSEAPGIEASGSADVPKAQKSSPAGEKFPTSSFNELVGNFSNIYNVSSKEVQCDSKRTRPPRKSWQSPKSK